LQTPSANASLRAKKRVSASRVREALECDATAEQIAHVHVDGVEAGLRERRRHLDLPVHTLLAQHGDARALASLGHERARRIVRNVEAHDRRELH
jgi:hypothetical protein